MLFWDEPPRAWPQLLPSLPLPLLPDAATLLAVPCRNDKADASGVGVFGVGEAW